MILKDTTLPASFVGKSGKFYVLRPDGQDICPTYAIYSSVVAYDTRSEYPCYLPAAEALADFSHELKIYAENLKTSPPGAAPWERDEPAETYRPEVFVWRNKFAKSRPRHVA